VGFSHAPRDDLARAPRHRPLLKPRVVMDKVRRRPRDDDDRVDANTYRAIVARAVPS